MSHFTKSTPYNIATLGIRSGFAITISTEGILEPGIVIIDAPAILVLTPFNVEVLDGGEAIAVSTASLVLVAPTVAVGIFVVIDTATLALTSFDIELDVDIVVDTAALTLTSFDVELDLDINVDLGQLVLTPQEIGLPVTEIIDIGRLLLTGFAGIAVNTAIDTNTNIRRGILANEIHIYLISPTLISTQDSFGFKLIGVNALPSPGGPGNVSGRRGRIPHAQDFSLQGWVSTDSWGQGQDPRSLITRRNNEETIRFLSTDFIAANNIDKKTLDELERLYPGTIHIFDKSDPDIYMHVKNVSGIELFYQLVNDTENFNVYLRHLDLIPADLDVIC